MDHSKPLGGQQPGPSASSMSEPAQEHALPKAPLVQNDDSSDSDGDYVYDIYYRPTATSLPYVPPSYAELCVSPFLHLLPFS